MSAHSESPASCPPGRDARWLVVINHHEARIFNSVTHGTASLQIRPDQSDEGIRHARSFDGFSRGQEKPEEHRFFRPVAEALANAPEFLVFGSGTGTANEMNQFIAWLRTHLPDTARRLADVEIIDEHHLTDAQLLARARDHRAKSSAPARVAKASSTRAGAPAS